MARLAAFLVVAAVALYSIDNSVQAGGWVSYGMGPAYYGGYSSVGYYSPVVPSYGIVQYGPAYTPVDVYYGPPPVYVAAPLYVRPAYSYGYFGYGYGPYREKVVARPHSYKYKARW